MTPALITVFKPAQLTLSKPGSVKPNIWVKDRAGPGPVEVSWGFSNHPRGWSNFELCAP